jgi:hypothetical protein
MKTKTILTLTITTLLIALFFAAIHLDNQAEASQTYVQLKWTNPMPTSDVAVSDDGEYLAAVNNTGLYFFDADDSHPLWYYEAADTSLLSVAISADGEYTVTGDSSGFLHYFNESTTRTDSQTTPTWKSYDMGGPIERGTLDMSANGNYTVLGGTGVNVWYYAGCITRTGTGQTATWTSGPPVNEFLTVDISPDGKYVAGGGRYGTAAGFIAYYKDSTAHTGYLSTTWFAHTPINSIITDLALSDDGYSVAAIDTGLTTLFYWANATNLTGDPNATWTNSEPFSCIDMSGTGDSVVAGGMQAYPGTLHFWTDSRAREDVQPEDWLRLESADVFDAAISHDGSLIATSTWTETSNYTAYFLTSEGTIIGEQELHDYSPVVSMSGNGATIAIGGSNPDSLYVFGTAADSTPPNINEVTQEPDRNSVYPGDEVVIFANVTDDESGVKQVTLNYTTGNGTWFSLTMEPQETDIYNGTIPTFPYCTTVTYVVIAEDYANNTKTTIQMMLQLNYHVIPEFTVPAFAAIFAATTLLAAAARRRKRIH